MLDRNFGGRRVQIVGSYQRLEELEETLKEIFISVCKSIDCLDLPKKIFMTRTVELTPEQKVCLCYYEIRGPR